MHVHMNTCILQYVFLKTCFIKYYRYMNYFAKIFLYLLITCVGNVVGKWNQQSVFKFWMHLLLSLLQKHMNPSLLPLAMDQTAG